MKKIILLMIVFILSSFAYATDTFYLLYETPLFITDCTINGIACNSAYTNCSLTITYPNGTLYINHQLMTAQNNTYTYLVSSGLNATGRYDRLYSCIDVNNTLISAGDNFIVLDNNYSYGKNSLIDYNFYIFLFALFLILLILFAFNKSMVIGVASGAIGILTSLFLWFSGVSTTTNLDGIFRQLNPTLSRAVGIILLFFSLWLFYIAMTYKQPTKQDDTEYAGDEE